MAERLPTIQEVQQIVDDPQIADDTKRELLTQYFDAIDGQDPVHYGFSNDDQRKQLLEQYQDRFDFTPLDLRNGPYAYEAYSKAQGQHDAHLDAAREAAKRAVDDGGSRLDGMKGSETSPGAGNSNELLDAGAAGLDTFRTWLPVYRKARAIVAPDLADYRFEQDVLERYDEQRDIPFDKFLAGAGEIVQVREAVVDAAPTQNQAMQNLFGQWEGDGKNAASASWTKFGDGVKTVQQSLDHAVDVVNRTVAAVAGSCRDKASWVLQNAFQTWPHDAGLTAQEMDRLARIAELGRNASADDFKHFTEFLFTANPALARDMLVGQSFGMSDQLFDAFQAWAKQYLSNFCTFVAGLVGDFQTMCENTRVAVANQWSALADELQKVPDDPFAAVGEAVAPAAASGGGSGGGAAGGGDGSAAGGGGAAGAMGGGAAPGGAAGGAAPTPAVAPPPPEPAAAPPVPEVVPPAAPPADPPDTLTVQRGDSKIEMSEPDRDGRMGISIDSGTGEPKDYQLSWGETDPAQPAYTPGPDGRIRIDDGAFRITAERPEGPDGPTVVTVDDGSGTPTMYTLGEADAGPASPGAAGPVAQGAAGTQPGSPPGARFAGGAPGAVGGDALLGGAGGAPTAGGVPGAVGASAALPGDAAWPAGGSGDAAALAGGPGPAGTADGGFTGHIPGGGTHDPASDGAQESAVGAHRMSGGGTHGTATPVGGAHRMPGGAAQSAATAADDAHDPAASPGAAHESPAGAHAVSGGGVHGSAAPAGESPTGAHPLPGGLRTGAQAADPTGAGSDGPGGAPDPGQTIPATSVGGVADGLDASRSDTHGAATGDAGSLGQPGPSPSGAVLGTAPDSDHVGSGLGMVPPMGGAAAQGDDEQERSSRAYRVDGDIFATAGTGPQITGSLDDEEPTL